MFKKAFLFLTEQNPCQLVTSDDRKEESRRTTTHERGSLADDVVPHLRSSTKRKIILTRTPITRAMSQHRYHDVVDVVFSLFLLTCEILISHSLLTVFRSKSAYVLNMRLQIRDVMEVNYFLQSIELTFCPEQKVFEHMCQLESSPY